jgi:hypothetical protein
MISLSYCGGKCLSRAVVLIAWVDSWETRRVYRIAPHTLGRRTRKYRLLFDHVGKSTHTYSTLCRTKASPAILNYIWPHYALRKTTTARYRAWAIPRRGWKSSEFYTDVRECEWCSLQWGILKFSLPFCHVWEWRSGWLGLVCDILESSKKSENLTVVSWASYNKNCIVPGSAWGMAFNANKSKSTWK